MGTWIRRDRGTAAGEFDSTMGEPKREIDNNGDDTGARGGNPRGIGADDDSVGSSSDTSGNSDVRADVRADARETVRANVRGIVRGNGLGAGPNGQGAPQSYLDEIGAAGVFGAWLRTTFASLTVRNYRYFFVGHGISLLGTWVRRTTMGWLVYQITHSTALLGAVEGLALLPMLFLSPTAGVFADRLDKRRIIIATQIVAAFASAAIAALIFLHWIRVWHLMALAILSGIAFAFEVPTRQAFVNDMVGRDKLMNAIALNSMLVNLSRIFGPAIAGVVMAVVGMGFCFALDALSYVVVIATLVTMKLPPFQIRARKKSTTRERTESRWLRRTVSYWVDLTVSHWLELREGFHEAWHNRRVRIILILLSFVSIFGWSFQTLLPAIAQDLLKVGEMQYGRMMAMFGVGAIGGALFTAGRKPGSNRRRQVFGGVWALCGGVFLLSLSGALFGSSPSAFYCICGALAFAGFGAVLFMSTGNTLVQTSVDDSIRGRIMGIWAVAFGGSVPLGNFLIGGVAELISPYLTIFFFTAVMLVVSIVIYRSLPANSPVGSTDAPIARGSTPAATASSPERRP